jgi:hypothetical protein
LFDCTLDDPAGQIIYGIVHGRPFGDYDIIPRVHHGALDKIGIIAVEILLFPEYLVFLVVPEG